MKKTWLKSIKNDLDIYNFTDKIVFNHVKWEEWLQLRAFSKKNKMMRNS